MSFESGFESRESRSLTQQVAVSSKSEVRQCWTIVWQMMSVEMARTAVGRTTIECYVRLSHTLIVHHMVAQTYTGSTLCCKKVVFSRFLRNQSVSERQPGVPLVASHSGGYKNFEKGGAEKHFFSSVLIYCKCAQRNICLLHGKKPLFEKKIWANGAAAPLWIRHWPVII